MMESDHFCLRKKMKSQIWEAEPRTAHLGVGLTSWLFECTIVHMDVRAAARLPAVPSL